ncbi:MAG TPA: D-alanyl-D-alanine carboxypeptidase family protein [Thermoanaerobaculia bacterium]|nr:D-alanyl-D-alanine carboxypeptidase family protein [Thermoanaerobaculia bacterium]
MVEPHTMTVLHEKNAHRMLPTASMVKMMTALVVLDAVEDGDLRWDTRVWVSPEVERVRGSSVYLQQGEVFTVRELLDAMVIKSANDAAAALAEAAAGSQDAFVERMRTKARSLGLEHSELHTPHGLPRKETGKPEDRMCPYDLARVGAEVLRHPELMRRAGTALAPPMRGREFHLYNSNHLLRRYDHATGIKTGYHTGSAFCLTASAHKDGMDLVAVVMGAERKFDSFDGARALLEEAFERYRLLAPLAEGERLRQLAQVRSGAVRWVPVMAADDVRWVAPRNGSVRLETQLVSHGVQAPVRAGQLVATVLVWENGQLRAKVPAVAMHAVDPPSRWQRWRSRLSSLLTALASGLGG